MEIGHISALKTFGFTPQTLIGMAVSSIERRGKFIAILATEATLIFHLAKAGWLRWYDELPAKIIQPSKAPLALRCGFDNGSGFDLTEQGTKLGLACYR